MIIYNFYNPGTDHPKWTKMEKPDVELKGNSYRLVNLTFLYITSFWDCPLIWFVQMYIK